ncbi:hypothetical protein [Variovorax soli]|uniref:Uncharacterized protein n=1 Tax=Variovorax soli TaxID=376815 RepID=A0ABU1N8B9_9BURK|nr:hypothetical protein [Variovorax soli]MDR6534679.1 hypothetical protein [Variovorax soli]
MEASDLRPNALAAGVSLPRVTPARLLAGSHRRAAESGRAHHA